MDRRLTGVEQPAHGRPSPIRDPSDARVDDYRDLRRTGVRPTAHLVVEGHLAIRRLLATPLQLRSLLVSPRGARLLADDLAGLSVPVFEAPPEVLTAIVGFDLHRGSLAVAERPEEQRADSVLRDAAVAVALEGVNDNENLGAVARAVVALGGDALLLAPGCADPLHRRSIRVSMGHVLTLPVATLPSWPRDLVRLQAQGWLVAALTPDPGAAPLATLVAEDAPRLLLLLGAEGGGLSAAALAAADRRIRIPMVPGVDSLNVAHAAAVALSHVGRAARASRG